MFCLYCQDEENMVEVRQSGKYTLEDFWVEFTGENFINGERKIPYRQFIKEHARKGMKGI